MNGTRNKVVTYEYVLTLTDKECKDLLGDLRNANTEFELSETGYKVFQWLSARNV